MKEKKIDLITLKIVKDKEIIYVPDERIGYVADVFKLAKSLIADADREHFLVFSLGRKNEINGIQICSIGTLSEAVVHPREIFKYSILKNADKIIVVHNHPSGDLHPSSHDIETTRRLSNAGNIIGIKLLDHLIINDKDFYSFAEEGLLVDGKFKI